MITRRTSIGLLLCAAVMATVVVISQAGPLNPPAGPVASTGRFGPRTEIHASDLPLTIATAGSYYLAETISTAGGGITIATDDVTIDLMGFALLGGTGDGIVATPFPKRRITVRNGTISGWSGDGVSAIFVQSGRFEDLILFGNGGDGLDARDNCIVSGCAAWQNGGDGISTSTAGVISNCSAFDNGQCGIDGGSATTITGCAVASNDVDGITCAFGGSISRCVSRFNGGDGYSMSADSSVFDCTSDDNGGNGIRGSQGCRIVGNNCQGNTAAGILMPGNFSLVEGNNVTVNAVGIDVTFSRSLIISNRANSNATNYSFIAGTSFGPIIDVSAGGDLSTVAGADHPTANYEY